MRQSTSIFALMVLVTKVYTAPQLISFKEGKVGVNFGGYHAAAGLGGLLGGGAGGGLFAEAGTPFGQAARAGLGGAVDSNGGSAGGLYAGATAGGNVKASAGLGGGVTAEKSFGAGFAEAQEAGNRYASSGLGGESSIEGSSGFQFTGSKSFGLSSGVVKETEVAVQPIKTVEVVKPVYKEVHTEIKTNTANEVNTPFIPLAENEVKTEFKANVNVNAEAPPAVIYKEVYVQPPPPKVVEKTIIHRRYKPHRHHFRKTAYIGGYIGGDGGYDVPAPPPPAPVVYKTVEPVVYKSVQPTIQKRVDVGVEGGLNAGASGYSDAVGGGGAEYGYTKQITVQRNPNFFADIFNIPISTLKAVGNFLGNAAGSTSVSVQKTASVQADSDSKASKHEPSSSVSSAAAQVSIQTPPASKFIDDIFSIPINTLGAVNKFLENNVPARKNVQVSEDGEPIKVKLGPHARRRANKRVVVVQESANDAPLENTDSK